MEIKRLLKSATSALLASAVIVGSCFCASAASATPKVTHKMAKIVTVGTTIGGGDGQIEDLLKLTNASKYNGYTYAVLLEGNCLGEKDGIGMSSMYEPFCKVKNGSGVIPAFYAGVVAKKTGTYKIRPYVIKVPKEIDYDCADLDGITYAQTENAFKKATGYKGTENNYYSKLESWRKQNKDKCNSIYESNKKKCIFIGDTITVTVVAKVKKPTLKSATYTANGIKITVNKYTAKGIKVYRYNGKNYKYIGYTSTTSYVDKNVKSGKSYKYKLRAYNKKDGVTLNSDYTSVINATAKPKTPKATSISSIGYTKKNGVKLTVKSYTATGVKVYRKDGKTYKYIGYTSGTTYTDKTANVGKNYSYKVRTYNRIGSAYANANYSKVTTIKT